VSKRGLGRGFRPDARDRDYRIAAAASQRVSRYWRDNAYAGNQGQTPHCVGFAWMHWLVNQPIVQFIDPDGIYQLAKLHDEWKGEEYDGTSVRAGAKVLKLLGFVAEYRWAWDAQTVADAILEKGPVVLGIDWYESMFEPGPDGLLVVEGKVSGGHAILANGYDSRTRRFRLKQSWEPGWGDGTGHASLQFDDLAKLLARNGEACLPVEREVGVP
jgi:hypothetical protein